MRSYSTDPAAVYIFNTLYLIVGQRGRGLAGDLNVGRDLFYTVGQWGYGKEVGPQENNVWGDGKPNGLV